MGAYTTAAAILREDFQEVDDRDGVFSGYDPETGSYDPESWAYEGVEGLAAPGNRTPPSGDQKENHQSQGEPAGGRGFARRPRR